MIPTAVMAMGDPMDGGPGGCCPALYVYSDGEWVFEVLFNFTTDVDTVLEHTLVSTPDNVNGVYKMQLIEVNDTSVIDYVGLTSDGKLPLVSAVLNGVNVKQQLLNSDDIAIQVDYMQTISWNSTCYPTQMTSSSQSKAFVPTNG